MTVVIFEVVTADLTVRVTSDNTPHPDALDELSRRCVRLFVEANASLPDGGDDADG